jgi:hypothetical protein
MVPASFLYLIFSPLANPNLEAPTEENYGKYYPSLAKMTGQNHHKEAAI